MADHTFSHDPTASREMPPSGPTSFEEAKNAVDEDAEDEGLGFVITRHDPFLVLEIVNGRDGNTIATPIDHILEALGETFTEFDDKTMLRALYRGQLPGALHGGDPVVITLGGDVTNYALRFYDSGWTPITGRHVADTPTETREIDDQALRQLLSKTGHLED